MSNVTAILTSCNRPDLLKRTIESFCKANTYPVQEIIIRDDSGIKSAIDKLFELTFDIPKNIKVKILDDKRKIGQLLSIDVLMKYIESDYIVHLEDDWEFYDIGFIEKAIEILKENPDIIQVWFRPKKDGFKHNILSEKHYTLESNYQYKLVDKSGGFTGFTWNPHLRRLKDYLKPFAEIGKEYDIGKFYKELGFKTAILDEGYCRHIGGGRSAHHNYELRG